MTTQIDQLDEIFDNYDKIYQDFKSEIQDLMNEFQIELIIYDEVELFRDYHDPNFQYPFQKRKEVVSQVNFQIQPNIDIDENYQYVSSTLNFKISQTCLEQNVFGIIEPKNVAEEVMTSSGEVETEFSCQQLSYEKLIFSRYEALEKRYSEDYEKGVVEDQILFEMTLKLDAFKSTNSRQY